MEKDPVVKEVGIQISSFRNFVIYLTLKLSRLDNIALVHMCILYFHEHLMF